MVHAPPEQGAEEAAFEEPVPGGRHDLEADDPVDPAQELARLQAELETPPEEWVPFQSSWQPSEQTWKPLADTWEQARAAPPAHPRPTLRDLPRAPRPAGPVVVTQTAPAFEPPQPEPPPAPAPTPPPQTAPAPRRSAVLLPLVWFNAGFDLCLAPWGPLGDWFKGRPGRGLLGAVGLLCLAGAVALAVADGIGWTW
jgi:hypothetical protein